MRQVLPTTSEAGLFPFKNALAEPVYSSHHLKSKAAIMLKVEEDETL